MGLRDMPRQKWFRALPLLAMKLEVEVREAAGSESIGTEKGTHNV